MEREIGGGDYRFGFAAGVARVVAVKTINVDLPDRLADEMARVVRDGWFQSENDLVRTALAEYLRTRMTQLQERFHREDIAWAVNEAKPRE
jgi:Arc/MetJ-type ribon-helix-helix transcriptional regulator